MYPETGISTEKSKSIILRPLYFLYTIVYYVRKSKGQSFFNNQIFKNLCSTAIFRKKIWKSKLDVYNVLIWNKKDSSTNFQWVFFSVKQSNNIGVRVSLEVTVIYFYVKWLSSEVVESLFHSNYYLFIIYFETTDLSFYCARYFMPNMNASEWRVSVNEFSLVTIQNSS